MIKFIFLQVDLIRFKAFKSYMTFTTQDAWRKRQTEQRQNALKGLLGDGKTEGSIEGREWKGGENKEREIGGKDVTVLVEIPDFLMPWDNLVILKSYYLAPVDGNSVTF